jgi:hypothetical protein
MAPSRARGWDGRIDGWRVRQGHRFCPAMALILRPMDGAGASGRNAVALRRTFPRRAGCRTAGRSVSRVSLTI